MPSSAPGSPRPASSWKVSPQDELHHHALVASWGVPHHPGCVTLECVTLGWVPPRRSEHLGSGTVTLCVGTAAMGTPHPDHARPVAPTASSLPRGGDPWVPVTPHWTCSTLQHQHSHGHHCPWVCVRHRGLGCLGCLCHLHPCPTPSRPCSLWVPFLSPKVLAQQSKAAARQVGSAVPLSPSAILVPRV